jgi:hypothetical protein
MGSNLGWFTNGFTFYKSRINNGLFDVLFSLAEDELSIFVQNGGKFCTYKSTRRYSAKALHCQYLKNVISDVVLIFVPSLCESAS